MEFFVALAVISISFALLYAWRTGYVRRRRERIRSQPFPDNWERILQECVALYRMMPSNTRERLKQKILVFIGEKRFEGCNGLEITDEIRLTVAAQACLLLVQQPGDSLYPGLVSILVYPDAYLAPEFIPIDDNLYVETTGVQSGESWREGLVVLSWKDVKVESRSLKQGYNVVLHEFAHQLDQENGWADGTPILRDQDHYRAWQATFNREFERIQEDRTGYPLDEYGAQDPAEFFAVATETFFHLPRRMRREIPHLYESLKGYYGLDPATWKKT